MVFFKGKAFPSLAPCCSLPLLARTPRNAPKQSGDNCTDISRKTLYFSLFLKFFFRK